MVTVNVAKTVCIPSPGHVHTEAETALLDSACVSVATVNGAVFIVVPAGSDTFVERHALDAMISMRSIQNTISPERGVSARLAKAACKGVDRGRL